MNETSAEPGIPFVVPNYETVDQAIVDFFAKLSERYGVTAAVLVWESHIGGDGNGGHRQMGSANTQYGLVTRWLMQQKQYFKRMGKQS